MDSLAKVASKELLNQSPAAAYYQSHLRRAWDLHIHEIKTKNISQYIENKTYDEIKVDDCAGLVCNYSKRREVAETIRMLGKLGSDY